jgi:ornithine cyclodeaminase/alanine dehydrogenase-like protein (mu-crystallin family)
MRVLGRSDVMRTLSMRDAIEVVERAFIDYSSGESDVPARSIITQQKTLGKTLFMPGYLPRSGALAMKIVSVHTTNSQRKLPLIHATAILLDSSAGQVLAIIEAAYLTALRTGAASGVATRYLARSDARTVAIFGAGVQGRSQLLAVSVERPLERAFIYDHSPEHVDDFKRQMGDQIDPRIELLTASSPAEAVREADIICTATTSLDPVFNGLDLRPGTHINAIGSYTPHMQEIDCETLRRTSKIVVDTRAGALSEAGDILAAVREGTIQASDIYAEIGEIANGIKKGRENEEEITYFKSVGNAVQDVAVAQTVYREAVKQGLGTEIDLEI